MRVGKRELVLSTLMIALSGSFSARSSGDAIENVYDAHAFSERWSGDYYRETMSGEVAPFHSFEEKRKFFLESPTLDQEVEVLDEAGKPLPPPAWLQTPWTNPKNLPWMAHPPALAEPKIEIQTGPTEPFTSVPKIELPPQSMHYYDRGSLKFGSRLDDEGPGYVKVFRERDEAIGGRSWGTRAIVSLITGVAAEFNSKFPGYERLQVADISREAGGSMSHASHQNGLEADIIYLRKDRKEQAAFGAYGRNGFAEQFVVRTPVKRSFRDTDGKMKTAVSYQSKVSSNFDVEGNFNLLRMIENRGNVKMIFVDKLLIRAFFRYVDEKGLKSEPDVRSLLLKLNAEASHADHFHLRLFCQPEDKKCISGTSPPRKKG